jgi:hypothetical protein
VARNSIMENGIKISIKLDGTALALMIGRIICSLNKLQI